MNNKTTIAVACTLLGTFAQARIAPGPEGPPEPPSYVPQIIFNVSDAFGGAFAGEQIRMPTPNNPVGFISDTYALGSGTSDAGKFLCNGCTIGPQSADLQELNDLINGSINAFLTTNLAWKLGRQITNNTDNSFLANHANFLKSEIADNILNRICLQKALP